MVPPSELCVARDQCRRCVGSRLARPRFSEGGEGAGHGLRSGVALAGRRLRHRSSHGLQAVAPVVGGLLLMGRAKAVFSFEHMDLNGDGLVDKEEYMLSAKRALDEHTAQESKAHIYSFNERLFDVADIDGDGLLSPAELRFGEMLVSLELATSLWRMEQGEEVDEVDPSFSIADTEALLAMLDTDRDLVIGSDEFRHFWQETLTDWGYDPAFLDTSELQQVMDTLFAMADVTGNGVLGLRELQYSSLLLAEFGVKDTVYMLFEGLDVDQDGRINRREVRRSAKQDIVDAKLVQHIRERFQSFDIDGNGVIDPLEAEPIASAFLQGAIEL